MEDLGKTHFIKLPIEVMEQSVSCRPKVACDDSEVMEVLQDLCGAIAMGTYFGPPPDEPPLDETYIFDKYDMELILKDLSVDNFVGKIKDVGKGAKKRIQRGYPQEYLYVFQYACELKRKDFDDSGTNNEKVLIYIKVNNRKEPTRNIFVISFHKNR